MAPTVTDNREQSRFEIHVGDRLAGFADYRLREDHITFTHTEVHDDHEGEGLGSTLARAALDAAAEAGLAVHPACPFMADYIRRHPDDYLALVPERVRERYGL
jgi:predicted GNAT family acetyltransferase